MAKIVAKEFHLANPNVRSIRVLDPFAGDGRLIEWLISSWIELAFPSVTWQVSMWDIHDTGFEVAVGRLTKITARCTKIVSKIKTVDAFQEAHEKNGEFDIVITNPPWELLKPDRREISQLQEGLRNQYLLKMRAYDRWVANQYPISQPRRKFAGWGTNLSRVGLDASLRLARREGIIGCVLPASVLADDQSVMLRKHLLTEHAVLDIAYYPAEAKLYDRADISSITVIAKTRSASSSSVPLYSFSLNSEHTEEIDIPIDLGSLKKVDFVLPVSFGGKALEILSTLSSRFPKWLELETSRQIWAGREIDETGSSTWLKTRGHNLPLFIKGRMIERYTISIKPNQRISKLNWTAPPSSNHIRIVWRDVSRPNQKRRMIATIIPPGWVAGNSLGVAFFRNGNLTALKNFLGVMNSTAFEFQLRAHLATGHVSLSALRKVALPPVRLFENDEYLASLVTSTLYGCVESKLIIDAYVAKCLYRLSEDEYENILCLFNKLKEEEKYDLLQKYRSVSLGLNHVEKEGKQEMSLTLPSVFQD